MLHIDEPVRVGAIFAPDQPIRPVWFDRRGHKHTIQEVTYRWRENTGAVTTLHFAVTDGSALFELVYDTKKQSWSLASLEQTR